jgi:5-formyltetrahydrofolate cyclo-ligase
VTTEELAARKAAVRDAARAARRAIAPDARELASQAVEDRVLELLGELAPNATVLGYRAIGDELDPSNTVAALRACGVRVAMPRVNALGELDLCEASESCEYVQGPFGILEPAPGTPLLEPADLDAAIIPGLAFDRAGHRVGYGKGFYDRLLPSLKPGCVTVGVAFEEQLMDTLPHDSHDAIVDFVVTPSGTWPASDE